MSLFSDTELQQTGKITKSIDQLESDCLACRLYKKGRHPKIKVAGEGKKKILIIGDYTNIDDDETGTAFSGSIGDEFSQRLRFNNIQLNIDCWRINALRCMSSGLELTQEQLNCCKPYLEKIVRELKPKLILLMGTFAVTSFYGELFSDRDINVWRIKVIPDQKCKCYVVPLFSPQVLVEKEQNAKFCFERDLEFALKQLNKPFFEALNYSRYVTILKDFKSIKSLLNEIILKKKKISFDYETSGLKPFRVGHKIASIGVAVSPKKGYAFPYQYNNFWTKKEESEIKELWTKILEDDKIHKIAFNAKFEEVWSNIFFQRRPSSFHFDPCMASHILDNRSGAKSLDFLAFVNFGVEPYDKHIAPFLKSGAGTEFNTVHKAPLNDLLLYNGLDCIFTAMLYDDMIKEIVTNPGLLKAYNFFMVGNKEMASLQLQGICMNTEYYEKLDTELGEKIQEIQNYLEKGREATAFQKMFGRPILLTSNQDLGKLFYEVLGKAPYYTSKGQYKTDKGTLDKLNLPFVTKLKEKKKYEKAKGTYLGQFFREICNGKIHPFFDLLTPVTFRSASQSPNFQNLPKRDKEIKLKVRKGIIPSPNCVLVEKDFKGAEVVVSAAVHKDVNFINYLKDKSTDMHRDGCSDLLKLPPGMLENSSYTSEQKALVGVIRFYTKNNWTFAQFYGDWFGSCAPIFWENVVEAGLKLPNGMTCKEWLETQGITELGIIDQGKPTPGSFLEHCKEVEQKMWNERFPQYTQWKKDIVKFYNDYGYIENYFGFRFSGLMTKNQCTNFPIQSASFHLLLYTLIEVQKFIKKNNLKTRICGQIHDSIISDVHINELSFYVKGVYDIVHTLKNKFSWLPVPMEIEVEISKTREEGGNFAEMKEIDPLNAKLWY